MLIIKYIIGTKSIAVVLRTFSISSHEVGICEQVQRNSRRSIVHTIDTGTRVAQNQPPLFTSNN